MISMKKIYICSLILLVLFSIPLQLFGIMRIIPLYVSSPILFLSFFIFIYSLGYQKKFKGF